MPRNNGTKRKKNAMLCTALAAACFASGAGTVPIPEPVIRADFDKSLAVNAGDKELQARLEPGARFIPSSEGYGIEPGKAGHAITIPLPDALWSKRGTVAFRVRPSRTIRYNSSTPLYANLLDTPVFRLELAEHLNQSIFAAHVSLHPSETTQASWHMPAKEGYASSRAALSHLKAGLWYHIVFAWDAAAGHQNFYLNGEAQESMRRDRPWNTPETFSGAMKIGGSFGEGEHSCLFAIDSLRLYDTFFEEAHVAELLKNKTAFALAGEGRWNIEGELDTTPYSLTLLYEDYFDAPLDMIREEALFDGERRVRMPEGKKWVLEGRGANAWTENGACIVRQDKKKPTHATMWNTREFPENILIEFEVIPKSPAQGLGIIFFAARNIKGGSPFELWMEKRDSIFRRYSCSQMNSYHISYMGGGRPPAARGTVNMRKNRGFYLPSIGIDRVREGRNLVRILKDGGKIRLEVNGKLALKYDDDGKTYGPAWGGGWIGLRQMAHTEQLIYTHFKVWQLEK